MHGTSLLKYSDDKFQNICALDYSLYVQLVTAICLYILSMATPRRSWKNVLMVLESPGKALEFFVRKIVETLLLLFIIIHSYHSDVCTASLAIEAMSQKCSWK